jgi:hypothetical protein
MAHIIFFSSTIELNGEIKLIRRDEETYLNPAPLRVDIVIRDIPVSANADPTLAAFHEPKKDGK